MLRSGDRLGEFEIVAPVKSGGMASIFLARRIGAAGFARTVAIKVVHPHLAEDPSFVGMFLDEARLSARIDHPNVVRVEALGEHDGRYFLVMEYVAGCALIELLSALAQRDRRLRPEVAVWIAMQVADGLHAAHETTGDAGESLEIVHRDVSPHNVLLAFGGHVKLIDFGIAKALGRSQQTRSGSLRGKLSYMSPEQARGARLDRRADIYALGIVLWELLTVTRLFAADDDLELLEQVRRPRIDPPSRYADDIVPALDAVVLAALAPDPRDRPPTAHALRCALAAAVPEAATVDGAQLARLLAELMPEQVARVSARVPPGLEIEALAGPTRTGPHALGGPDTPGSHAVIDTLTVAAPTEAGLSIDATPAHAAPRAGYGTRVRASVALLAATLVGAVVGGALRARAPAGDLAANRVAAVASPAPTTPPPTSPTPPDAPALAPPPSPIAPVPTAALAPPPREPATAPARAVVHRPRVRRRARSHARARTGAATIIDDMGM